MEAPGLGAMLLDKGTLPEFGLIDALVEDGLAPLDETFLADLVGPSALSDRRGRIDVVPAFGRRSIENPGEVLAKIARAYAEDIRADGTAATILDQVSALVDRFADPERYDAILIDSRAGLHETTASAILGLGADVFLFGLDEPQTFQGFAALLAHLARFVPRNAPNPEWLERLTFVQGKAPTDHESRIAFADKCRALLMALAVPPGSPLREAEPRMPAAPFHDVPWDDDALDEDVLPAEDSRITNAIAVLEDERFRQFDPMQRRDLLSEEIYRSSYAMLTERITAAFNHGSEVR
jgi:hypothetical protein